jgi:hypothetical protein
VEDIYFTSVGACFHLSTYIIPVQEISIGLVMKALEAHARLSANGTLRPCRHGPQGMHNEASRDTLEHEFGTSNDREVIFHILEKGKIQESVVSTKSSCISAVMIHIHYRCRCQYLISSS